MAIPLKTCIIEISELSRLEEIAIFDTNIVRSVFLHDSGTRLPHYLKNAIRPTQLYCYTAVYSFPIIIASSPVKILRKYHELCVRIRRFISEPLATISQANVIPEAVFSVYNTIVLCVRILCM